MPTRSLRGLVPWLVCIGISRGRSVALESFGYTRRSAEHGAQLACGSNEPGTLILIERVAGEWWHGMVVIRAGHGSDMERIDGVDN